MKAPLLGMSSKSKGREAGSGQSLQSIGAAQFANYHDTVHSCCSRKYVLFVWRGGGRERERECVCVYACVCVFPGKHETTIPEIGTAWLWYGIELFILASLQLSYRSSPGTVFFDLVTWVFDFSPGIGAVSILGTLLEVSPQVLTVSWLEVTVDFTGGFFSGTGCFMTGSFFTGTGNFLTESSF